MLSLNIHHNIHLTREQRYALHAGEDVSVVGVSIPVWLINKITSEPAKEVFCMYYLKNPRLETPIMIMEDGYEINLPYRKGQKVEMSNEEWRELRNTDPAKLDEIMKQQVREVSSKRLLDLCDGGCAQLNFKERNNIRIQFKNNNLVSVMHHVCISTMEKLTLSLR